MEARQISIEEFLSSSKTRFIIPVYQRNYDWKEKNCFQLFNDIRSASIDERIKSHFMGSVVYVSNSDTDSVKVKDERNPFYKKCISVLEYLICG